MSQDLHGAPRTTPKTLGLRAQIMVALGVSFGLSVLLLGFTTSRLGVRAIDADRRESAQALARSIATIPDASEREEVVRVALSAPSVLGVEFADDGELPRAWGVTGSPNPITARVQGRVVRLHLASAQADTRRSLPALLFLYVGITAAGILLLAYVLLTRSIVRPVEILTRASERLAEGKEARVTIRGAAEVARLALAFNDMQTQLTAERAALTRRLAELERATNELASTQRSLVRSEKMASVGRLAAGIAHEIGNPLSAILGLVELVQDGDLSDEEQREFLGRVRKETERISHIIRDLLDFARNEPSEDERRASCDLVEVVEDAVRLVGPQKDLRQVTLERRFDDECPRARGSAPRLAQVVLNLLLNAADAIAGEGTIRLEVHPGPDDTVLLIVQDTGPGIPEDVFDHIFEPFVTSKPTGEGTGLGLAVCHALIEHLGGTLTAENPTEGGARFTVSLPAA